MRPIVILAIGGGVLALGALAVSSSKPAPSQAWRSVHGLPLPPGWTQAGYEQTVYSLKPYEPLPDNLKQAYDYMQAQFAQRRKLLPPDAKPFWQDGYSTEQFIVAPSANPMANANAAVDQWGRPARAPSGQGGGDPLGAVLQVAGYTLPFVPGIGPAASAALAGAIALGQGKSLQDAGLAAARAAVPLPLRPAFDLGVGVVLQHKSIDKATEDALWAQIPGGKKYYEQAKQMAKHL